MPNTRARVKMQHVRTIVAILLLAGCGVSAVWAQQHGGHGSHAAAPPAPTGFSGEMHATMTKMSKDMEAVPMTGDPDKDFLSMMIPHHEGAIEMARLVLAYGRDPLVRKLADAIITAQQAEITTMRQRLDTLR